MHFTSLKIITCLTFILILCTVLHGQHEKQNSEAFLLDKNQDFYYEAEMFGINDIVQDDYVVDIEKGEDGIIYWANRRQLLSYEKGAFREVFNLSTYKRVKQLFYDGQGRLWILFNHQEGDLIEEILLILDTKDFTKISIENLNIPNIEILEKTRIRSIFHDKNGRIHFFGNADSIFILQNGKLVPTQSNITFRDNVILDLDNWGYANSTLSYKDGNYILKTDQFSNSQDVPFHIIDDDNNNYNALFKTERLNTKYLSRHGTLLRINFQSSKTVIINDEKKISILDLQNDQDIRIDEEIPDIFKNRSILGVEMIMGDLWISTNKGLFKIHKHRREFKSLLENRSISVRNIINIGKDSVVIAHENGISLYSIKKKTLKTRVTDIAAYGMIYNDGKIIFHTYSPGLLISNIKNNTGWEEITIKPKPTNLLSVKNIYNLGNGNALLLQSEGKLSTYDLTNDESRFLENQSCPINDFYSIFNINNELIITGDNGACTIDIDNMTFTKDNRYPNLKISHIYKPTDSIAWISTKGNGLLKKNFINRQLDTFKIEEGLLSLNVHSTFIDSHQRLWASTDFGISVLDINTNDIITLTSEDGIHENEMNIHSFLALPDSSLMYGTLEGVIHFSPNDIDLSFAKDELNIEELIYTNTRTNKEVIVSYNKSPKKITLESNFEAPKIKISSRFKNKSNNIRYHTSGSGNSKWKMLKNHYLDLSELTETNNTIYVSYRIGLNEWSKPKIIEITKKLPLHLRSSFYSSCLAILTVLLLLRFVYLQKSTAKRNLEIEELVKSQTLELSKKIVELSKSNSLNEKLFSIIGHDLKSPLTSLLNLNKNYNYLVSKGEYEHLEKLGKTIETNSRNLLSVVDRLLDWTNTLQDGKLIITTIHIESLLKTVLQDLEELLKSKNLNFKYDIDGEYFESEKESISIILRNLLQNAMKYSYENGEIIIKSTINKTGNLTMTISDTGIGMNEDLIGTLNERKKVFSRQGTKKEKGLGIGLSICHQLINRIGGTIELKKNSPKGSTISLTILRNIQ